jgi:hypothetical protein
MINDAPHDRQNPLVQYGQINATTETGSESEHQLLRRRLKRRGATRLRSPLQTRRRERVSSSGSSSEEDSPPQHQSPARDKDMGHRGADPPESGAGADHPMPDAPPQTGDSVPRWLSTSEPPPDPEDDGWLDDFDLSLEDEFLTKCVTLYACSSFKKMSWLKVRDSYTKEQSVYSHGTQMYALGPNGN